MPTDTRRFKEQLRENGFSEEQADSSLDVSLALLEEATTDMATKEDIRAVRQDLDTLRSNLRADFRDIAAQMQAQMQERLDSQSSRVSIGLAVIGVLIALLAVLVAIAGF